MRKTPLGVALALAIAITLTAVTVSPASAVTVNPASAATPVQCGSTITTNTVLTADLRCSGDGPALTVVGGAVLDLGRHTVSSPGRSADDSTSVGVGIQGVESGAEATVRNGTITGFAKGIDAEDSTGTANGTVQNVLLTRNGTGIFGVFAKFTVTATRFVGNDDGLLALFTFATISGSKFVDNASTGVTLSASGGLTVAKSLFHHNGVAVTCSEVGMTVSGTTFTANTTAISAYFCEGATVSSSNFVGNTTGYYSTFGPNDARDELLGNRFAANTTAVDAGVSTYLARNTFVGNKTALRSVPQYDFIVDTITMEKNHFTLNTDAVYITGPASIRGTVAIKNSGYGIYAPNATDLGGNIAHLNGITPQCTGVVCD